MFEVDQLKNRHFFKQTWQALSKNSWDINGLLFFLKDFSPKLPKCFLSLIESYSLTEWRIFFWQDYSLHLLFRYCVFIWPLTKCRFLSPNRNFCISCSNMACLFSFLIVLVLLSLSSASPTNDGRRMKKQVRFWDELIVKPLTEFLAVNSVVSPSNFKDLQDWIAILIQKGRGFWYRHQRGWNWLHWKDRGGPWKTNGIVSSTYSSWCGSQWCATWFQKRK